MSHAPSRKPAILTRSIAARLSFALATAVAALLACHSAHAQTTYYWDGNNNTAGFGNASGTWAEPTTGTATAGWSTSSTGGSVVLDNSVTTTTSDPLHFGTDSATFGLGSGTITVSGTVDAASLRFGNQTFGNIVLSGGTINLADTTIIHVGAGGTTVHNITSTITGAATSLTKTGNTLMLSGANSYTGSTIIPTGTLILNNATALGGNNPGVNGTSSISMGAGTTLQSNYIINDAGNVDSFVYAPITLTAAGTNNFLIGAGSSSAPAESVRFNLNGAIGGTAGANVIFGNTTVTRNNADSIIVLGAASTYDGNTTIQAGHTANRITVINGVENALPTTTVLSFDNVAGSGTGRFTTYDLDGNNQTLAGLHNTSASLRIQRITSATAATLTINNSLDFSFGGTSGQITGAITLAKSGAGNFTLDGNNTYTGGTTITGVGRLIAEGSNSALGNSAGAVSVASTAFLRYNNNLAVNATLAIPNAITGAGTLEITSSAPPISGDTNRVTVGSLSGFSGNISVLADGMFAHFTAGNTINQNLTIASGGYMAFSEDNGFGKLDGSGTIIRNAPGTTGNTRTLTLGNGNATGGIFSGIIRGESTDVASGLFNSAGIIAVTKEGTGIQTLSGLNTYAGDTTVNGGALRISNNSALGATAGSTVVNGTTTNNTANARLELSGGITVTGEALTINGSGNFIGALTSFSGDNEWAGNVTIGSVGTRIGASAGATLKISGIIDSGLVDTGISFRSTNPTGVVVLSGPNTYLGITSILVGKVQLDGGNDRLPVTTNLSLNSGSGNPDAEFDLNGRNQEVAGLTLGLGGAGTPSQNSVNNSSVTPSTLTVNTAAASPSTYAGILKGNLALIKSGADSLTLSGTNSYTGTTTVTVGKLILNNAAANNTTIVTDANTATTSDILIDGGTLELAASEQIANTGSINMTSGAFNFGAATGKTETIDKFTNSGGTFTTGANTLIGLGNTITWSGGTNTISDGGSVQDQHIVISGGTNTVEGGATGGVLQLNSGGLGLEMSNGATLTLNSDNGVAGKLLLKGDVSTSGDSTVTIASGLGNSNAGNIDLDGGTRIFTVANGAEATDLSVSAVITNGALTKAGAGTMAVTAANTYSGGTTITGGTLLLGGSERISDASGLTLAGGTFSMEGLHGVTETMASLTLSANSTLDFGTGSYTSDLGNTLRFSTLTLSTHTLTIHNWSGPYYPPGASTDIGTANQDRLLFASSVLGGNDLSQVSFYSDAGTTFLGTGQEISFGGAFTNELAPIPEPTTVFGALALLGLAGCRGRRRK